MQITVTIKPSESNAFHISSYIYKKVLRGIEFNGHYHCQINQ